MAIDIRATVTCSLGTLISGSISDDYIQGSGLVKTRGSVEISALITPAIGTAVTFSYVKDGVTRSIPRKLRVLSSFADPFRRTTKVELGCKLTYLSDLKEAVDWSAFDDPENAGYDEDDARIVTLPIHASSVMNQCLTQLGITASGNPLTNKFSIAAFDFSPGYVQVLSDLLVSESYCGYLDTNEVLQVFNLDQDAGTGPVFTSADIVDLGPIGVGQLPGEAVNVSYSTLKLKPPEPVPTDPTQLTTYNNTIDRINWERAETISSPETYYVNYKSDFDPTVIFTIAYTGVTTTLTTVEYQTLYLRDADNKIITKEVPLKRTTLVTGPSVSKLFSVASSYYSVGQGNFNNIDIILAKTVETYEYDSTGNEFKVITYTYEPEAVALASAQFDWVYENQNFVASYNLILTEYTEQETETYSNYRRVTSTSYTRPWATQPGQQAIAILNELGVDTLAQAVEVAAVILGNGLVHKQTTQDTRLSGSTSQERPPAADRINAFYAKNGDPNNGWRTENTASLELALGSATAERRIELSMPYAPDDTFKELINPLTGLGLGVFTSEASDAPAKANRYGRVQNRLLLGNRSGINLQLAPERLPAAPYSPLYLQASGLTALYRANGTNWAFDSNGIVCSVDALFWAAVGGTGTFWFPVAPGVTTLPAEPPIVDGQTNATSTILPYNETAIYDSRIRIPAAVTKFDYSLELLTEVPASVIKTPANVYRMTPIYMPAPAAFTVAAAAPRIDSSVDVRVPNTVFTIAAKVPQVGGGIGLVIDPPATDIALSAPVPTISTV